MISSLEELEATQIEIDTLLGVLMLRKYTEEEAKRLNYLGDLLYQYESQYIEIEDVYGKDMINYLMEDGYQLSLQDYEWVFNLVNSDIELDESIIERLSKLFHVSPSVFLPRSNIPICPSSGNVFKDIGFSNADEMLKNASLLSEV